MRFPLAPLTLAGLLATAPAFAQSILDYRIYTVERDDRDAVSVVNDVRVSGFAPNNPVDYAGNDSDEESAGMQFRVNVPRGTTVLDAHLYLRAGPQGNPTTSGALEIHLQNVDDAQPFVNGSFGDLVTHHPTHPVTVGWAGPSSWVEGADYRSANLAELVQAWIDRPGYQPGNHIGFVITEGNIQWHAYYGWLDFAAGGLPPRLLLRLDTTATDVPRVGAPVTLLLAAPNPFRDDVGVRYSVARETDVTLSVYDAAGRLVRTVLDGPVSPGTHRVVWDGRGTAGQPVTAGVYFVRLFAEGDVQTDRIVRPR